jgi:hypothetical protein
LISAQPTFLDRRSGLYLFEHAASGIMVAAIVIVGEKTPPPGEVPHGEFRKHHR